MTALALAATGWGGGFPIAWGLMGVALWIVPIALILLVVRAVRTSAGSSAGSAVRLLEERYARGEITREEFLERRAVLGGRSPAAPGDDSR
jgi:putative membrane protein